MYAQVINGNITQIADEQSLRQLYPSTHFPSPILESHLEGFDNWYVCEDEAEAPAFNPTQKKVTFERVLKDNLGILAEFRPFCSNYEAFGIFKAINCRWTDFNSVFG